MSGFAYLLGKTRKPSGKPAWYWWLFAVIVFLLGLVVVWWVLNRNNRELARLRHAKEKARIEREQADAYRRAWEHTSRKAEALLRVELTQAAIDGIEHDIQKVEKQHEIDRDSAMRLRWSDLPRADS